MNMNTDQIITLLNNTAEAHGAKKDWFYFFQAIHLISLKGMGVGQGGGVEDSGEGNAVRHVKALFDRSPADRAFTIFDVGAHSGKFARLCSEIMAGGDFAIYGFEPSAYLFGKLVERADEFGSRVEFVNQALGAEPGRMSFFSDRPGSALGSVYQRRLDHFGVSLSNEDTVSVTTIDAFCRSRGIGRIDFLKMDVEGHEMACLKGGEGMIRAGQVDSIMFEFGGANIDSKTFFQDFWYFLENYKMFRVMKDGLVEIEKYHESLEMFQTQNFLAVRKGL